MSDSHAPLGDLAQLTVGHVGPMASEYVDHGIPFLRSQNVRPFSLDLSDVKHIREVFHDRLAKSALVPGDVVVVRTGVPGAAAVIPSWLSPANCSDLVVIRPGPQLDSHYLCYFINGAARGYVDSRLVGAVQQHFNVGAARELLIPRLSLTEQRAIGEVLGALDDKIEANRVAVEKCETLAHRHVAQFEPSIALGTLATVHRKMVSPVSVLGSEVEHFSLPAFDAGSLPLTEESANIKSGKFMLTRSAVLVSKLNPHIPRAWLAVPSGDRPAVTSTEFVILEPEGRLAVEVLWAVSSSPQFFGQLVERVKGTTGSHQRVAPEDVLQIEVPDPHSFPVPAIDAIISAVRLARSLRCESFALAHMRDALLPGLLSGEVRVRNAEPPVGEAV